jgi:hypothetical protein
MKIYLLNLLWSVNMIEVTESPRVNIMLKWDVIFPFLQMPLFFIIRNLYFHTSLILLKNVLFWVIYKAYNLIITTLELSIHHCKYETNCYVYCCCRPWQT